MRLLAFTALLLGASLAAGAPPVTRFRATLPTLQLEILPAREQAPRSARMPTSGQEFVIDLTPLPDPVRVEGALLNLVRFRGHPNPVRYAPPWTIRGNDTEARLTPPGLATGAHIRSKTLREPLSFFSDAPDDLAAVQRWALGELPACQSTPRLISHERNTLHLNRMQTVELRFEYIFQGHLTEHAVLVAPRSSHQVLLFAVYGPIKGFSDLHRVFQQSLYSLTGF